MDFSSAPIENVLKSYLNVKGQDHLTVHSMVKRYFSSCIVQTTYLLANLNFCSPVSAPWAELVVLYLPVANRRHHRGFGGVKCSQ